MLLSGNLILLTRVASTVKADLHQGMEVQEERHLLMKFTLGNT